MPIPVYNEQAQRYQNTESGKFVKTKDAEAQMAAQKGKGKGDKGKGTDKQSSLGAIAGPIVASLRKEFSGLNKHLAFRFEDIKRAILGPEKPTRAERLAGEDVPKDTTIPEEREKGDFFGNLKRLNPFGKDKSPFVKMIAWGAAFLALQLGSDKLAGPDGILTKFLRWLKETFMPFVTGVWVSIRDYDWKGEWAKVKNIFDSIKKFFADMDVDGDGKISFDELKEGLKKGIQDLQTVLVNEIEKGLKTFVKEYGLLIAGVWVGYRISKGLISALLFGGAPKVGLFAGMKFLGLVGIIIGGLVTLHNDIEEAYKDVLDRDGKVTTKTLISRFLSGANNPEGKSWTDAILGSWKMGLQGAAVGLTAGLVTGGVFSIPLAAIGFITGATASAMGAHLGEDKLNQNMEDMETNISKLGDELKTTGNRIYEFFKGVINAWM